jgi:hypothetical protein
LPVPEHIFKKNVAIKPINSYFDSPNNPKKELYPIQASAADHLFKAIIKQLNARY